MLWGANRGKWKGRQPLGIEPRTPGLCSQCSATELRQPDIHQPPQSSICTAQVGLKCLSCTPGSHSVCAFRTPLGVDRKILSIRKEPVLSGLDCKNAALNFACTLARPPMVWESPNPLIVALDVVSRGHTPFYKRGKGSGNFCLLHRKFIYSACASAKPA